MTPESRIDNITRLFQECYGLVVRSAHRYAPGLDGIDDIVQQVYIDFVSGALENKWDLEKDVGPLLFQIAKRKAQTAMRERRRESSRSVDVLWNRLADRESEKNETLERDNAIVAALHECLKGLPPESRALVEKHYFRRVAMKDIAEQLGKKITTIHNFFFRVRLKLRECIERKIDE